MMKNRLTPRRSRYSLEAILMLLPVLILYGIVVVYPLLNMLYTSFFSWNGIAGSPKEFVGFANYAKFWKDSHGVSEYRHPLPGGHLCDAAGVLFPGHGHQ